MQSLKANKAYLELEFTLKSNTPRNPSKLVATKYYIPASISNEEIDSFCSCT